MDALDRAFDLAALGPLHGPNPRVGCVITAADGAWLGEGFHRGAGSPHAEVEALQDAAKRGHDVAGATAWVTLEPCNHQGRTGPCAQALAEAGVGRVVYAMSDPNPVAQGGGAYLLARRVGVVPDVAPDRAADLNPAWLFAVTHGRPLVTLKQATTLDGYIAAVDGTSQWITGEAARAHAHGVRAAVDAVGVGTGTLLLDDPQLTARRADGALMEHQPLRVVIGQRDIPAQAAVNGPGGQVLHFRTHNPHDVVRALQAREVRHFLIEGGATIAAAFLQAGLVDSIHAYIASTLLGEGTKSTAPFGVGSLGQAPRWRTKEATQLGADVFIHAEREAV
ncbi:MAG: bifunctional diaminohydroxyphosphoribosylaminopyrimidine deaminase/5-amino-6-(5-phosphoribosylamino)uracil reductase RibD [Bifidobacteriaceae bacterium]|jgi:diaminohydroxyphosphoribosylaminopyrimidine deaminase/5-amino-6-(5-phosphoribosylamino)uracil reductase|nr:bifunctional diaminohydroxyphosphoribosylaminopyrimidine deaminase/5-amino-6-(5-phosphoribosylamino)uracil reductase RibD [Bifidobacteriaceae bacterium]